MAKLTRRSFLAATAAAGALRGTGIALRTPATRRILTLVYDKGLGAMRAVEKVVPL